ncbi:hypothetical protein GCM10009836_05740 [Pseudonocardia ailaonensis]|uniref:Radical SAM core domain-containing protein n=1 Tax=Pseudonocardia ailaonensis TaxID=367279 RepID=A0ABN2MM26_9PSEU
MPAPQAPSRSSLAGPLGRAEAAPAGLSDADYEALLGADGADLRALTTLADSVRRDTLGDGLTFVANRNLDTAVAGRPGAEDLVDALVDEARALGATEICLQGPLPAEAPDDGYRALVARITGRAPLHLHAFRPAEIADGARRAGLGVAEHLAALREAGLGSVPGTGAKILDDELRTTLLGGPDLPVAEWVALIEAAHAAGLRSTSTIIHGHLESPAQVVAHLRTLAAIQDRTGGFSEFIAMPMTPDTTPPHLAGRIRGADEREVRAVHAVARLLLHGRIDHVQAAWPKLGPELTRTVLAGGADDVGGLLLDGRLLPGAGPEEGLELTRTEIDATAAALGRTVRQRTTLYDVPAR